MTKEVLRDESITRDAEYQSRLLVYLCYGVLIRPAQWRSDHDALVTYPVKIHHTMRANGTDKLSRLLTLIWISASVFANGSERLRLWGCGSGHSVIHMVYHNESKNRSFIPR